MERTQEAGNGAHTSGALEPVPHPAAPPKASNPSVWLPFDDASHIPMNHNPRESHPPESLLWRGIPLCGFQLGRAGDVERHVAVAPLCGPLHDPTYP